MKKSAIAILLALTFAFTAFVAGFYFGRNYSHSTIQISGIPKITMPASSQSIPQTTVTTVPTTLDATTQKVMVLINAATEEIWDQVPGIGSSTAQKILEYQKQYGQFEKPEDLLNVSGIGPKTLDKIMDHFLGRLQNENTSG